MLKLVPPKDRVTIISPERDRRNRRLIPGLYRHPFQTKQWEGSEYQRLYDHGTPEERAAFVKRKSWILGSVFLALILACVVAVLVPLPKPRAVPPPEILDAGTLVKLQLHETALSTSTTVVTTSATYQVRGAVSGAPGDAATLKTDPGSIPQRTELCISSAAKSGCYGLL